MHWWQTGIIYQIYPRSFQDSDGDGVGDLNGIRRRLDYLQALNVDAIWISPIFPSPMHDFGYDVADYCDIHPLFGTLDDFDRLLAEAHGRGLRVILDLVPNHTSEEHAWFVESRSSRDNPKRDYYIWADPAPGAGPPETRRPNNWETHFGGPAWTYDAHTGQFYMHQFHRSQPELNYRHPDVLPAMLDNMRFWLDRGVDGFRVDVIWLMLKDAGLRDEPPNPDAAPDARPFDRLQHIYTADVDGIHDIVRRMRAVLDEYDERMMVGEIYLPLERLMTYYGDGDECHMPFNFQLINTALERPRHWRLHRPLRGRPAARWLAQLGAGQPRPAPHRHPRRPGPGPRGPDAAADTARHADLLLRRRDRHGGRAHPVRGVHGSGRAPAAGAVPGLGPRPGADADAVGRQHPRRLCATGGAAVAAAGRRLPRP
jgi:glycosidase